MKLPGITLLALFLTFTSLAGSVEKVYYFSNYKVNQIGNFQNVTFGNTTLSAKPGEPVMPYHAVAILLPPGEMATGIEVITENEIQIPGTYDIYPQQYSQPLSKNEPGKFIKNEALYRFNGKYPTSPSVQITTQYMNGFAFALSAFTPMTYNPAAKTLSYFTKVTIRISTKPSPKATQAMELLSASDYALKRVHLFAQNPEMISLYPDKSKNPATYQYLIITPEQFISTFDSLVDYYAETGIQSQVTATEYIDANIAGHDLQQKIRNYIRQEVTSSGIEYVLLGGDVEHVPFRGFYCYAISDPDQEDYNIPADIYYSALDGEWNDSTMAGGHDNRWGEPGEDDLLPDVSLARFPFSSITELKHMVHKSVFYQKYPVLGEFTKPYMAGEYLYSPPPTYGSDYMELLIDDHNDNGYFTHGIPSAYNTITRLYDIPGYDWDKSELIAGINQGTSFIHHLGHSNYDYMMRMGLSDVNNQNFSQVNGVNHNFALIYTQGCIDGAFDYSDCIAEKSVTINNFCVAGVFNSRFGWFNQGTTDGPSQHLQREFVSALYNDTLENQIKELGSAHMMSKIKTAPWVGLPGEFEPGAQRWVHYDCNALGDPALKIWTVTPSLTVLPANQDVDNKSGNVNFNVTATSGWTANCDAVWCTVTASGNSNGTITASYTANQEELYRTAHITVNVIGAIPVVVTVTQAPLVSVDEIIAGGFRIYPNPATDNINITFNLLKQGDVHLRLINVMGQIVRETLLPMQTTGHHSIAIDISGLKPGVYSCSLLPGSGREINKMLIVK